MVKNDRELLETITKNTVIIDNKMTSCFEQTKNLQININKIINTQNQLNQKLDYLLKNNSNV